MATLLLSTALTLITMKTLLFIGGTFGFVCGFAFSFIHKESWVVCLWHGGMTAILSGVLLTWWDWAWTENMKDATVGRQGASEPMLTNSTNPKSSQS